MSVRIHFQVHQHFQVGPLFKELKVAIKVFNAEQDFLSEVFVSY